MDKSLRTVTVENLSNNQHHDSETPTDIAPIKTLFFDLTDKEMVDKAVQTEKKIPTPVFKDFSFNFKQQVRFSRDNINMRGESLEESPPSKKEEKSS